MMRRMWEMVEKEARSEMMVGAFSERGSRPQEGVAVLLFLCPWHHPP
jgi:hypothetical protein